MILQRELPPDQRETAAHLHQERLDVVEQSLLDFPLLRPLSQAEELEVVGVLYRVANELESDSGSACSKLVSAPPWRPRRSLMI